MYRIDDRQTAIMQVQKFLMALTEDIFIAPSGVFDDNTRLAVIVFQKKFGLEDTGVVDFATFELLYREYAKIVMHGSVNDTVGNFLIFPMQRGDMSEGIFHINTTLAALLDYYGITHRLRASSFYSEETALAVSALRKIYMLDEGDHIDELLYFRMINDYNSQSILAKLE